MKAIAIILGLIVLLFGLAVGGCAVVFLADSVMTGWQGPGAGIAILAAGFLLVAAGVIALAVWILRRTSRRRAGRDGGRHDVSAP